MKTAKPESRNKKIVFGIMTILMVLIFISCSKEVFFMPSTIVPAADGKVTIKTDKNKNYIVQVQITNLAAVDRLQGNKVTYVVWMISENERMDNIGQLTSKRSGFSKLLKASLTATTPSKPVKVMITAENDGKVQYPLGEVVMSTDRF